MTDDPNATPGTVTPVVPLKKTPVSKYKAMVKPDTTQQPMLVQKADGTIGPWGNPLNAPQKQIPLPATTNPLPLSDKARGLSNSYYPANQQQQGAAIPSLKKSSNY